MIRKLGLTLMIIAYLPLFIYKGICIYTSLNFVDFGEIFTVFYNVSIVIGVGLFLLSEALEEQDYLKIPIVVFFFFIGISVLFNALFDSFLEDYILGLLILIIILTCYLLYYLWLMNQNRKN